MTYAISQRRRLEALDGAKLAAAVEPRLAQPRAACLAAGAPAPTP